MVPESKKLKIIQAGQIIATSHDRFSPKWWFSKGNPLISGKSGLVKYYNLTRLKVYSSNKGNSLRLGLTLFILVLELLMVQKSRINSPVEVGRLVPLFTTGFSTMAEWLVGCISFEVGVAFLLNQR